MTYKPLSLKKRLLNWLFWGAALLGVALITVPFWLFVPSHEQPQFLLIFGVLAVGVLIFHAYEERQRAQREEELRRIKEAIRDTLWEMRQNERAP
jgi:peptidoglycan/LPS O-acetylase OafA/YrhL